WLAHGSLPGGMEEQEQQLLLGNGLLRGLGVVRLPLNLASLRRFVEFFPDRGTRHEEEAAQGQSGTVENTRHPYTSLEREQRCSRVPTRGALSTSRTFALNAAPAWREIQALRNQQRSRGWWESE